MFIIKILATVFGIYFLIRVFGVVFETGLTLATYGIMRFIGFFNSLCCWSRYLLFTTTSFSMLMVIALMVFLSSILKQGFASQKACKKTINH